MALEFPIINHNVGPPGSDFFEYRESHINPTTSNTQTVQTREMLRMRKGMRQGEGGLVVISPSNLGSFCGQNERTEKGRVYWIDARNAANPRMYTFR